MLALLVPGNRMHYTGSEDNLFLHRSWRHNLATALWCEKLADDFGVERPVAYTAGILHDIGRIALLKVFPHEYAIFMDHALTGDLDNLEAERDLCDADHCQVGASLSQAWNFPSVLQDLIGNHHEPITRHAPRPRLLVQTACTAASISGFHTVGVERAWEPSRIDTLMPHVTRQLDYDGILEDVALKLNQTERSLL